jgi:hypothetical protein
MSDAVFVELTKAMKTAVHRSACPMSRLDPNTAQLGNVRRIAHVTQSNCGSPPYHLGAQRSIRVIGAGQRTLAVI